MVAADEVRPLGGHQTAVDDVDVKPEDLAAPGHRLADAQALDMRRLLRLRVGDEVARATEDVALAGRHGEHCPAFYLKC